MILKRERIPYVHFMRSMDYTNIFVPQSEEDLKLKNELEKLIERLKVCQNICA